MTDNNPVVFIVDDDVEVREALVDLVDSVGLNARALPSAQAFLDEYDGGGAGCLVLDIRMPGMNGLELQQQLKEQDGAIPIIFLTGHGDIPMAVEAMRRGAVDFMPKPFREQELLDRIQTALEEGDERRQGVAARRAIEQLVSRLTPREREVMEHVVEGEANKVIAIELGVSERTIEVHRAHVMEKMQVRNLAELVRTVSQLKD